jgi:septal ring factor EnvC (AmiA/AmiB activator)
MKEALDDAYRYAFSPSRPENESAAETEPAALPEETPAAPAFAAGKAALSETPAAPVSGSVVRSFGFPESGGEHDFSYGTEVDAVFSSPVCAMLSGEVAAVGESRTKGSYLVIFSDGAEIEYSGLGNVTAEIGAEYRPVSPSPRPAKGRFASSSSPTAATAT